MSGPPHPDTLIKTRGALETREEKWIRAFAAHAAKRFETRALVRASVNGGEPVPLAYVFAIPGGGLVLMPASKADLAADKSEDPHHRVHHELWERNRGAGQNEIWIAKPDQAVFFVERPEEGTLSTGFGLLGLSRTPDLILPRSATTPEPKTHHDHF